ncbi:MAG: hypothetical protein WBI63_09060 [Coriobacteriia bacterium]
MIVKRLPIGDRLRRDDGLSMIEVVVSAVIFFFVLTAVLGLIGTTTMMGQSAKQRTVMVNALNTYVEHVQSLEFAQIDLVGTGAGVLSAESTQTVGEYLISIRPTVSIPTTLTSSTSPLLKRLAVEMTVTRGGSQVMTYATSVLIRDRAQYLTNANAEAPTVAFDSGTPPEGTIVWSDLHAGGSLDLGVDVAVTEGRLVYGVSMWSDNTYILERQNDTKASWTEFDDQMVWSSPSFIWYTLQQHDVQVGTEPTSTVYSISDGMRTISAYAIDSAGVSKYTVRHYLVDNWAPPAPGRPTGVGLTDKSSRINWDAVLDGTTPAPSYRLHVWQQRSPVSSTLGPDSNWDWPETPLPESTTNSYDMTSTDSFGRYCLKISAESPRNIDSLVSDYGPISVCWFTKPRVYGTYIVDIKSNKPESMTTSVSVTPPSFPVAQTPVYRWYRVVGTGAPTLLAATGRTVTETFAATGNGSNNQVVPTVYYYCEVYVVPDGYGATEQGPQTVVSNKVGPSGQVSGTFPDGVWSW